MSSKRSLLLSPTWSQAVKFGLLASALPVLGYGQAAAPAPAAAPADEDTVILSPFVVSADSNVGYTATQTLAGTRLNTSLRDLGAAISVVTPEFLKDTNVTNLEELLPYTTATEIGGVNANYSAANFGDSAGRQDSQAVRREPQAGARVRAFSTPVFTRGYFSTSLQADAYNIGSVTMSRGANSLLFGLGTAGGVIEASPNQAMIGKSSGSVTFRYGAYGSNRSTVDYNYTVIPDRLAVRFDLLNKNDEYQQSPAFDRENRQFVALTAVLLENKGSKIFGKTILRANAEMGKGNRTPPTSIAPLIAWDAFFKPPPYLQTYSGKDYEIGGGYAALTANWKKWAINDTRHIILPDRRVQSGWFESGTNANLIGRPDLAAQNHSSAHLHTQQIVAVFNGSGAAAAVGVPGSNLQGLQAAVLNLGAAQIGAGPTDQWINTRAYNEQQGGTGFKVPSLTDRNVFDYRNWLITGNLEKVARVFNAEGVTLEQSFFKNRAGIEAALYKEFYRLDYQQPFGGGRNLPVYIDTTQYLPGGARFADETSVPAGFVDANNGVAVASVLNPNVGRAFMVNNFAQHEQWRSTRRDSKRVTTFYDLNFKDFSPRLGKWFGQHVFTGLWQKETRVNQGLNYNYYWQLTGPTGFELTRNVRNVVGTTPADDNARRNLMSTQALTAAYISGDNRGLEPGQVRLQPMAFTPITAGTQINTTFYDMPTFSWKTGTVRAERFCNGATGDRLDVTSKALAWQSKLFNDHIIGLMGWRGDRVESWGRRANITTLDGETQVRSLELNDLPNVVANGQRFQDGNTFTWSVVGHVPKSVIEKLPSFISSLSTHYGVGENFQPSGLRNDVMNNVIDSPKGTTVEYGVTLGLKNDKWILKLNHFESSNKNTGVLGGVVNTSVQEALRPLNGYRDAEKAGRAFTALGNYPQLLAAGYTSYEQLYAAINNLIPQPARAIYQYVLNTNGSFALAPGNPGIIGLSAVSDVDSKGWELELTANPTPNWRITMNATQVEAVVSNSAQSLGVFQAQYVKNLNDSKLASIGEGPDSIVNMLGRYNQEDVAALVAQQAKDGAVAQELRKYRVNMVTNYKFTEGRLNGFNFGGVLRWQSAVTIGYATQLNQFNNQIPILSRPYRAPSEMNGDVFVGYTRKLTSKIKWQVQLNYRNLIGRIGDIPVVADPDGFRSVWRMAPERSWALTNTFSF